MQVDQIKFVANTFETLIVTKSFALGTTGVSLVDGQSVEFDGSVVIVNGVRYPYPNLRGAVKLQWLVRESDYESGMQSAPASANIGLRPAVTNSQSLTQPPVRAAAVTVQSDERVVMTHSQRQEKREEMSTMRRTASSRTTGAAGSAHEGVVVGSAFKTPARSETKLTSETAGAAMYEVNNIKISPGVGQSESEYLARLSEEDARSYLAEKEARRSVYHADLAEKGISSVVAKVGAKTTGTKTVDGITATVKVGGGTEIADLSGLDTGKAELSAVTAEGMTFRNTNGPKKGFQATPTGSTPTEPSESKIGKDGTADARRRIAKALCSDFPEDYSFDEHWKRRLSRLHLHYSERSDVIRAIFAAESDDFKRVILEEFPDSFNS
jgi:hypothetical protein